MDEPDLLWLLFHSKSLLLLSPECENLAEKPLRRGREGVVLVAERVRVE